jgi:IS5 family transposase
MLRTVGEQASLWEALLPPAALVMPAELERVDRLLDDARFFAPYERFFHARLGRPSIPIECYLRLMFLKYRYQLGFEPLCREVTDSITWQRFCRIPLGGRVPHPTTLMKITTRCGEAAISELNDALIAKAAEARVLKMHKVRADTTVVEANVAYPVDSSLLAKGVARLANLARRANQAGLATRAPLRDRSHSAHRVARQVVNTLRRRGELARDELRRLNAGLARTAAVTVREAEAVVRNARRKLLSMGPVATGRARATVDQLERLALRVSKIAAQTRQRVVDGRHPTAPLDSCHFTTPTPDRSAKDGWDGPSSSATKPKSSTTPTGSSWTGPSSRATPLTPPTRTGDRTHPHPHRQDPSHRHRRSRLRRSSRRDHPHRPRRRRRPDPSQRQARHSPPPTRSVTSIPAHNPMAHRRRGAHQLPQTRLRMPTHPDGHHPRSTNLDRPRHLRPQPHQDRHPHQHHRLTTGGQQPPPDPSPAESHTTATLRRRPPNSSGRSSQVPENAGSTRYRTSEIVIRSSARFGSGMPSGRSLLVRDVERLPTPASLRRRIADFGAVCQRCRRTWWLR